MLGSERRRIKKRRWEKRKKKLQGAEEKRGGISGKRERGVFKATEGERGDTREGLVYESRVRADATAVLMPHNSLRLFTLINKGKAGKTDWN